MEERDMETSQVSRKMNKYLIPLFLVFGLVPLMTRYVEVENTMAAYTWFTSAATVADMSLYYRNLLFCMLGVVMLICVAGLFLRRKKMEKTVSFSYLTARAGQSSLLVWLPLLLYILLAMLSSFCSKYASFAINGTFGVYQTIFTLISYGLTAFYAYLFIREEKDVSQSLFALYVGMAVICLIGLSQFFGHDFFQTEFGESLILPSALQGKGAVSFNKEGNQVYSTLFNSNYIGSYAVLCAPLVVVSTCFAWKKKKRNYTAVIGGAFLFVALMLCLFGSQSRAGILILAVLALLMLVLFRKSLFKNTKTGILAVAALVVLGGGGLSAANAASEGVLFTRISNMFSGVFAQKQEDGSRKTGDYMITDIQTNKDDVIFTYRGENLKIQFDLAGNPENEHAFTVMDGNGTEIPYKREDKDSNFYRILDERFPECYLSIVNFESMFEGFGFQLMTVEHRETGDLTMEWIFSRENLDGDGTYYYCNPQNGRFVKLSKAESADLFKDSFLHNRGYIWNHTLPLLKYQILLGSGANTFAFDFPNDDYLGLYNSGHMKEYIDKPHNMYLQTFMETGGLSLLALLVFFVIYLVQSLRLYWKSDLGEYLLAVGAAILLGCTGYLFIGFVNDSMVVTAPLFWGLLGIGFAVNHMNRQKEIRVS